MHCKGPISHLARAVRGVQHRRARWSAYEEVARAADGSCFPGGESDRGVAEACNAVVEPGLTTRCSRPPIASALDAIVETCIAHYVMPRNSLGDALHLALTSYYGCHFLLTWNCLHLANANKFEHIRHVNALLWLYVPIITTPVELLTWEGG